jgi:hypothetical protein
MQQGKLENKIKEHEENRVGRNGNLQEGNFVHSSGHGKNKYWNTCGRYDLE